MSGIHEKVCVACQSDAEPASSEEINQFVSETEWSLICLLYTSPSPRD